MKKRFFLLVINLTLCAGLNAQLTEQIYLSGKDADNTVTWDFFCTAGRNSGKWSTIEVPSCWELQGYGSYNYGRDYRTYGREYAYAKEEGMYRHHFSVPAKWKGKKINIVFEGSMTDTKVVINGISAGPTHQGAFYRFKYDISDKLRYGQENLLEVTVSKESADNSINNAERRSDYWVFGGIFRPVYLEALPEVNISRWAIDSKADGTFKAAIYTGKATANHRVTAEITDADGKVVGTAEKRLPMIRPAIFTALATTNAGLSGAILDEIPIILETKVENPATWNAETPHLYRVRFRLWDGKKILHEVTEVFGFRTVEVRQGQGIFVNGVQVKMKGVNRHVFWPETGRTSSRRIDLLDIQVLKEMNMNAVRCSHYPPDKSFLYLCDSLGLYVLDELAGWQTAYSTEAGEPLVAELVVRDVNHPSIILWSNGNEGGTNKELDDDFGYWDFSQRQVIHAHHQPDNAFGGIDCNHYEGYASTVRLLQGPNIYMPTEFIHAQDDGGGAAGLYDYWEAMWKAPLSGGGFLWAFSDESIVRTDWGGILDANRVNGPDGLVGPYREREGSFYAIREIYSPVQIQTRELPADFNGTFPVENRYHFSNLNTCRFIWELVRFREPSDIVAGQIVVTSGEAQSPSVAPLATGTLSLSLPANWKEADALTLKVTDKDGTLIQHLSWKIRPNAAVVERMVKTAGDGEVSVTETDRVVTLKASGISVSFNKADGMLGGLRYDFGLPLPFRNGPVLVGGTSDFTEMRHFAQGNTHVVEVKYAGDMKEARWTMYPSGWLRLDYLYDLTGERKFAGISFDFPEVNMMSVKWVGNGPYRVWKNREQGMPFGAWEKGFNDTRTGLPPLIYPEFKGYHADVAWMEFNTVDGKFLVATPDERLYFRLFDFYSVYGPAPAHPELPAGNISFMDAIPPTASKPNGNGRDDASNWGPASRFAQLEKPSQHTLWFYFGLPK